MTKQPQSIDTIAAQAGSHEDRGGAVSFPLYFSSNYRHESLAEAKAFDPTTGYSYSRLATPNRRLLEETLVKLEGGQFGFALSSGMAAIQLALSILKTGDQLISLDDLYGGDFRYFRYLATHAGINFAQWNGERIDDLLAMIEPNTRLI